MQGTQHLPEPPVPIHRSLPLPIQFLPGRHQVAIVRDHGMSCRQPAAPRLVQLQLGENILPVGQLGIIAEPEKPSLRRRPRKKGILQGFSRSHENEVIADEIELGVGKDRQHGGTERAQQILIHELRPQPLHEGSFLLKVITHQVKKLASVKMGGTRGPGMGGLGNDRIIALVGEAKGSPHIIHDHLDALILERIDGPPVGNELVGADHFSLQFHHVNRLD